MTAVELDLFTVLGEGTSSASQLGERLGLHPRGTYDFFDKKSPAYIGGLPEMLNARLFGFWNDLGTALKTGKPQNEIKHGQKSIFEELYSNQASLGQFLDAMTGFQAANFAVLAEKFDFLKHKRVSDVGGPWPCSPESWGRPTRT